MTAHSESAKTYVQVERRSKQVATWMDVAAAYDAGMRHGLEARKNAAKQVSILPARVHKCAICGFTESAGIHTHHLIGKTNSMGVQFHAFTLEPYRTGNPHD